MHCSLLNVLQCALQAFEFSVLRSVTSECIVVCVAVCVAVCAAVHTHPECVAVYVAGA